VFDFALTVPQQAQFNTLLAMPGSSGFFEGLNASLGCGTSPPPGCLVSNDGPDTFVGFAQTAVVPGPIVGAAAGVNRGFGWSSRVGATPSSARCVRAPFRSQYDELTSVLVP
jgi:hypothetical protein